MKISLPYILLFLLLPGFVHQPKAASVVDSLLKINLTSVHDTVKINTNIAIARAYLVDDKPGSDVYAEKYIKKALRVSRAAGNLKKQAQAVEELAFIYQKFNRSAQCVQTLKKLLVLREQLHDTRGKAKAYYRISSVYFYSGELKTALKYARLQMQEARKTKDKREIARAYLSLGVLYGNIDGYHHKAEKCYIEEIKIRKELNDSAFLGSAYNNYGSFLLGEKRYTEGEYYLEAAVKTGQRRGDSLVIAYGSFELGNMYLRLKQWEKAQKAYATAISVWENSHEDNHLVTGYRKYAEALFNQGKAIEGYRFLEKHVLLDHHIDSLQNVATLNALEAKYQGEKKGRELKILTQKGKLREAQYNQNQIILWSVSGGLVLVLAMMVFIYRGLRQKKTANKKLAESYFLLEEKNNEILGSIHYAKRIQDALLKEDQFLKDCSIEHFILFKPRDIVSGDFFWSMHKPPYVYMAVADCTGHGVPGALLTMLGSSFLNEIISLNPAIGTADLLNGLRDRIIRELNQEASFDSTRDGMDISLLRLHTQTNEVCWSGANNPLWIVKSEKLKVKNDGDENEENSSLFTPHFSLREVRADKQPVGFYHHMSPFSEHHLTLQKGDLIYLFSDGYADQFGGDKLKKLKTSNFKKLISSTAELTLPGQKQRLQSFFDEWKGNNEQLDDVCVAGIRL